MTQTTHKPEPVQYLYRDHFITREDAADYVVDPNGPGVCGWLISGSDGGGILGAHPSVDDCTDAIDQVVDDAEPVCEPSCIVIPRW